MLKALKEVSFNGVTGHVSFQPGGDRLMNYTLMSLQGGQQTWQAVGTYTIHDQVLQVSSAVEWMDGTRATKAPAVFRRCCPG